MTNLRNVMAAIVVVLALSACSGADSSTDAASPGGTTIEPQVSAQDASIADPILVASPGTSRVVGALDGAVDSWVTSSSVAVQFELTNLGAGDAQVQGVADIPGLRLTESTFRPAASASGPGAEGGTTTPFGLPAGTGGWILVEWEVDDCAALGDWEIGDDDSGLLVDITSTPLIMSVSDDDGDHLVEMHPIAHPNQHLVELLDLGSCPVS